MDSVSEQKPSSTTVSNFGGQEFAGSKTCSTCHQDIYEKHSKTAHFLTSQLASENSIKGSFESGKNSFAFNNSVHVDMEKRNDGYYQVEYYKDSEKKKRRMDIVIGSGTMGQSFLNWRNDHLFQLPITYFAAANTWSNSPGFPDKVVFNRVITSRCLECHTTYTTLASEPDRDPEKFDKSKIIYGVDCEKCHGPAAKHVEYQLSHPNDSMAKFILNPASYTRQQQLDLCALCHGGRLQKTKPSFQFTSGQSLSKYFVVDTTTPNPENIDVHGNQYGLLRASKCFQLSQTLTCNSCHDTHQTERGNTQMFSRRCMNCHDRKQAPFCPLEKTLGAAITSNCIDCHMPVKPSRAIAVFLPNQITPTAALIRSHYIDIYPDETRRAAASLKRFK